MTTTLTGRPPATPPRPATEAAKAAFATKYRNWTAWVESGDWQQATSSASLALPANASDIMVLALDPDVSIAQLVQLTSRDQVLAARMLRLANSAYCAPLQAITTIGEAVVRLGTTSVRNVVLAACMASRLQQGSVYGPLGRGLADHGIGTAFLAQLVAKQAKANAEQAFLYGLVHDLGKLLVLQLAKDFVGAGGLAVPPEELADGMRHYHAEFSGRVLAEWNLPTIIQQPAAFHHDPDACVDYPTEAAVAYVANRLSHRYGCGCPAKPGEDLLEDPIVVRLGITASWLETTDAQAPELINTAIAAFS
jgi:HD-like signal output (HDOD) protein